MVFRPSAVKMAVGWAFAATLGVCLALAVFEVRAHPFVAVPGILACLVFGYAWASVAASLVLVSQDGIAYRWILRTRMIPAADIANVSLHHTNRFPRGETSIHVERADGTHVRLPVLITSSRAQEAARLEQQRALILDHLRRGPL